MNPYKYTAKDVVSKYALTEWIFESYKSCETCVLPDGCRDFIVQECAEFGSTWFVSDLSHSAYKVPTSAGMRMSGIRLQPGVEIRLSQMNSWLQGRNPAAFFGSDQLDEFCIKTENLTDALDCLASGKRTVLCVARELGVSLRSLQRLVKSDTGQTPQYWFSLARVRKAGRSLINYNSLSDAAIDTGFADQAHMNREMKKWFRRTPYQIKTDTEMLDLMFESGYG